MLMIHLVSLILAVFTLNYYISARMEMAVHRLLPMAVGLIGLYELCQIGRLTVGNEESFLILEDLLVLQIMYLITHYILDFYFITINKRLEYLLSGSVVLVALITVAQFWYPKLYLVAYNVYTFLYLLCLLGQAIYIYCRTSFSKQEHVVVRILCLALILVGIAVMFRKVPFIPGREVVTVAFMFTVIAAFYLMKNQRLIEDAVLMQMGLFDTAEIGVVLYDTDFYVLEVNKVARAWFPKDLNKSRRDEQMKQFRDDMKLFAEKEKREAEFEQKGSYYHCMLEEFHYQGKLRGYILSIMDITKQKYEMKNLERLKREAEDQSVQKSKVLASMSHDLRSPLHAIIGATNVIMEKKDLTAVNRSYVQIIRNSSEMLLGLVNDILLHSKLEAGKLELASEPYSLEGMLKELSQMVILNLQTKPVGFYLEFGTVYPAEVIGDRTRVREILQNILSNAVKFTEKGEIYCKILCEPELEKERVKLICEIKDTGVGMSKEQIDSLFEEYASFASQSKKEGTGLGMSIVRQLAELMGGSAWARSDGITGSTICVNFYQGLKKDVWCQPVCYEKKNLMARIARTKEMDLPSVYFRDAKVLLVDDIEVNRTLFAQLAWRWKVKPDLAASGAKALELVRKKEYHLIFLDLMMPVMDGMETAVEIKKMTDTPLILLTADASDETKTKSLEAGFADYMCKPIDTKLLGYNFEKYIPRECCVVRETPVQMADTETTLLAKRAILETVETELEQLCQLLPEYQKSDLAMFRIKVHGIKGFTRQIQKEAISRKAEILEMAAKTENHRFIEENMEDFLQEMTETIEEIKAELLTLPKPEVVQSDENKQELLAHLKEAFDDYDLKGIQKYLEQLKSRELDEKEQQLLLKLTEACEEIDYELGSSILEAYL